jgi:putative ABC transport system permease protein
LLLGVLLALLLSATIPALPVEIAPGYALLAQVIAISIGLASGVLPAIRAAGLEPVDALRAE